MSATARIVAEFERRRSINGRYSWRAFARTLGVSHSVLSRLSRRRTQASAETLARIEARLGGSLVSATDVQRDQRLDALERLVCRPDFTADARWLAVRMGLSLDEIQMTVHDALRRGRLVLSGPATWRTSVAEEP